VHLTPRTLFRAVALTEAVTWALLLAAMLAKYGFDAGDLPVSVAGPVHGLAFLAYALTALVVGLDRRWPPHLTLVAVAVAVVPFATVPLERSVERRGLLDGGWATEATDDPADRTPVRRALRWMLTHPVLFTVLLVATLAVVMSVLLALGPPTEWAAQAR
jgi:integral membrane protein